MSEWNFLEGVRIQHLEPLRADPERYNKLKLFYITASHMSVPLADIMSIARSKNPDLLQDVHVAEQSYLATVDALRLRNERLQEYYRSPNVKRERFDFETGRYLASGPTQELYLVKEATDALYLLLDRTMPKLQTAIDALQKFIAENYKGYGALKMVSLNVQESAAMVKSREP